MKDLVRRGRSKSVVDTTIVPPVHSLTSPRMAVLPKFPLGSLRRRDDSNEPPVHTKSPLLTLKLSSRSFLDSSIGDGTLRGSLYDIKTVGTSTTVMLNDHRQFSVKIATIHWPRVLPTKISGKDYTDGVHIQFRGTRYLGGETLLKLGTNPNSPRKFNLPNYSQPMKWKRYGNTYWCTTHSVKGPIAVLETPKAPDPITLTFFETLHDKYNPNAITVHKGVSVLLLDYVLITAMLLVTDLQEWMVVRKYEGNGLHLSGPSGQVPSSTSDLPSTSDPKFRKIMFGEPIYPKLAGDAKSRWLSEQLSPLSPTTSGFARTKAPGGAAMPADTYPESDSSSSQPASPKTTMATTMEDDLEDDDGSSFVETPPLSVVAESLYYSTPATSNTYISPPFLGNSQNPPPVPQIPLQFKSLNGRAFSSQPSTPMSASFRPLPESTRPNSAESRIDSIQSYPSNLSQPVSTSIRRPLPRPPPVPPISSDPPLARRMQSLNQLRNSASPGVLSPPGPQRSLPPTPSIGHVNAPLPPEAQTLTENHYPLERVSRHSRQPPITKASQEDLTNWVHTLTNPQRDLPPAPLPSSSIFDVPPPAYNTIVFSPQPSQSQQHAPLPPVHAATSDSP